MLDFLWRLFEHKDQLAQDAAAIGASVVAFCAVLSTVLPPASQPGAYATIRDLVNKIGQNYGHAANAKPNIAAKPRSPFI